MIQKLRDSQDIENYSEIKVDFYYLEIVLEMEQGRDEPKSFTKKKNRLWVPIDPDQRKTVGNSLSLARETLHETFPQSATEVK